MLRAVLVLVLLVTGCSKDPEKKSLPTSNKKIQVDLLFTHDGTSVYRFEDGGRTIYYAVPYKGPIELTEFHMECTTTSDGKNVHTDCNEEEQSTISMRN